MSGERSFAAVDFGPRPIDAALIRSIEQAESARLEALVRMYLKEIARAALQPDEESRLLKATEDGEEEARFQLTEAHLQTVVSIASTYVGRGIGFLDLVQEGNMGLVRAVEAARTRGSDDFPTHAAWWIWSAIVGCGRTAIDPAAMRPMPRILLTQAEATGVSLTGYTSGGRLSGSSWHLSLDDARRCATALFAEALGSWRIIPETVMDPVAYALGETR